MQCNYTRSYTQVRDDFKLSTRPRCTHVTCEYVTIFADVFLWTQTRHTQSAAILHCAGSPILTGIFVRVTHVHLTVRADIIIGTCAVVVVEDIVALTAVFALYSDAVIHQRSAVGSFPTCNN